jgi:hypothetical protein
MQSKLSRNSRSRVSGIRMEKENVTHIMNDKEMKAKLKGASPICKQGRVTGSLINTSKSGVSSTTSLGTH